MTHTGDNNFEQGAGSNGTYVPNIAYTLGDYQPVRSTYIAHDPFFFMDVSDDMLEEELLAEYDREVAAFSTRTTEEEQEATARITDHFDMNCDFFEGVDLPCADLSQVKEILENSRYSASLLEFAESNHIAFIAAPAIFGVEYNRAENVILFQPHLNTLDMLRGILGALRQAWQNFQGALLQPVVLYPDHAVFISRAQKADMLVSLLRAAWELNLNGYQDLWAHLEGSAMRDMAQSFAREARTDFRRLNNGIAAYAAFETWFLSDRSKASDGDLIHKMLSDYSGYQFADEDMSQLVMVDLIKAMGEMPYGKNYLAQHIVTVLSDPIFSEVRERSAANFLWFIKFEKTFNDMEQSLQLEGFSSDSASFPGGLSDPNTFKDGLHDESEQTGILVPFPASGTRRKARHGGDIGVSAEIIPFDITVRPFNQNFFS